MTPIETDIRAPEYSFAFRPHDKGSFFVPVGVSA